MNIIKTIESMNWMEILKRAAWTFLQAFLAVVIVSGDSLIDLLFRGDWNGLYTLSIATGLAGIAAGLSAIKSIALEVIGQLKGAN